MKKISIIIFLLLCETSFADTKLSEISFKDSTSDWIEIALSPPLDFPVEIKDDKTIATITKDQVSNESFVLIHFKAEKEEIKSENNVLHIYTTKAGLTGTTEQITIESNGKILDAVCWENSKIPQSEQKDIEELLTSNAWTGECINSEEIKEKQSITKTGNNNNKDSWQILQKQNSLNGDTSTKIFINEILANPKGKDKDNEWIELYNDSNKTVNLGNWELNNGKSFILTDNISIKPKSFLILEGENLDLTLKNNSGEIKLIDFAGNIIDKVNYKEAKEGLSFSKTQIKNISGNKESSTWEFSKPTKNSGNQILHKIEGEISTQLTAEEKDNYFFKITDKGNTITKISLSPEEKNIQLIKTLLRVGTTTEILAQKNDTNYLLANYKIKNTAPKKADQEKEKTWYYFLLFPITMGTCLLIHLYKTLSTKDS
jgi:hypothetical protein